MVSLKYENNIVLLGFILGFDDFVT